MSCSRNEDLHWGLLSLMKKRKLQEKCWRQRSSQGRLSHPHFWKDWMNQDSALFEANVPIAPKPSNSLVYVYSFRRHPSNPSFSHDTEQINLRKGKCLAQGYWRGPGWCPPTAHALLLLPCSLESIPTASILSLPGGLFWWRKPLCSNTQGRPEVLENERRQEQFSTND